LKNTLRNWHFNRPSKVTSKISRWLRNPIGAVIRFIEFSYFKVPLVSLLKSVDHFREVSHLNSDITNNVDCLILPGNQLHLENNLVLLHSGHILFVRLSYQSFLSGLHAREIRELQKSDSSPKFVNAIALPKQEFYYHFVVEYLPEILRLSLGRENSYIITLKDQPNYVKEYLQLLNIPVRFVSKPTVRLLDSVVPINLGGNRFDILSSTVNSLFKMQQLSTPKKILILRRGLPRDNNELNEALVAIFTTKGFCEFAMEDLPIASQIHLFRNAREIVAIHGGALSNLIYSEGGTRVLEIFSSPYRNFDFERISKSLDLSYTGLDSTMIGEIKEWAAASN